MANSREVVLTLNPGRIVGGPHDLVCPINRQDLPDEMFDPQSPNRAYGPDARFFDSDGNELARDYVANSFVLDSASRAGDGRVEYWLRLSQISTSAQGIEFKVEYGDPALGDHPAAGEFGRFAAWADSEFSIVGSSNVDRSGNSSWGIVGFPAVEFGAPFESYRRFSGSDRYQSFSPNVGNRLRTTNWTLSVVSLRERYGYSVAAAGFSGTQPVRIYPADSDAASGARLTWGTQISGTQLSVPKSGNAGLWQWMDVAVTQNTQRLRINGNQIQDDEAINISDPGSFSGGSWAIGGAPDLPENWGGALAAVILWKTSKSDGWIVSNHALAQAGTWSFGEPQAIGGDPILHQEAIGIDFLTAALLSRQLRLRAAIGFTFTVQLHESEMLQVHEIVSLETEQNTGVDGSISIKDALEFAEVFSLGPDGRGYIAQNLGLGFSTGLGVDLRVRFHEGLSLNVAAELGEEVQRSLNFAAAQSIVARTAILEHAKLDVSCPVRLSTFLDITAVFHSHLDGLAPPEPVAGGPRYYGVLPAPQLLAPDADDRLNDCHPQEHGVVPQADDRADELVQRSRILIPEFDLRKTRSGE